MSSMHMWGKDAPGNPGGESEIRALQRRVREQQETIRRLHERTLSLEAQLRDAPQHGDLLQEIERLRHELAEIQKGAKGKGGKGR